ncbi:MAG: SMP-30/gluconolactonase/LRE family protein, partial [Planctomycetota bacterium]
LPDGRLAVAVFGSGRIALLDADGSESASMVLPGPRPTNCCLADDGSLIVTEAGQGRLLKVDLD